MITVKTKKNTLLRSLVSALLILSMLLVMLPIFAADEATAELEGTVGADKGATVDVVVLTKDIASGKKITSKDVEVKKIKNVNIPDNVLSATKDVVGLYAKFDMYAGEYIYKAQLTSDESQTGEVHDELLLQAVRKSEESFVYVTDYVPANTGKDVAALIQNVIDVNPNRTIYFPDGEYIISKPLVTASDPAKSNALYFSDGAVLKADAKNWKTVKGVNQKGQGYTVSALIGLGAGGSPVNNNRANGSYFSVIGGIFDCSGVADGISIDQGREPLVRNVIIKDFKTIGISIPRGTNSSSSDADVEDVTIIGNGGLRTVGISLVGYDNTVTNAKIYNVERGFDLASGGNALRNIQVYYDPSNPVTETLNKKHAQTYGINETCGGNFIYQCYVENCGIGIRIQGNTVVDSCRVVWNQAAPGSKQVAYAAASGAKLYMSACAALFFNNTGSKYIDMTNTGNLKIEAPIFVESLCATKGYANNNLRGGIVPAK